MRYTLPSGERVPGVSTIVGMMRRAEPLMAWAWAQGKAGLDYRDTAQRAADSGILAHRAAYNHLHGREIIWPDDIDQEIVGRAKKSFEAFLSWQDSTALICDAGEVEIISPTLRCGGRFDALLSWGKRVLAEWKTSAAIYPEHLVQLIGYGLLFEEAHPDEPIHQYLIGRFDKSGDYHIHVFTPPLDEAREAFLACRRLYDLEKRLAKRLQ